MKTEVSVHNVKSIKLGDIQEFSKEMGSTHDFVSRSITVTEDDGNVIMLALFTTEDDTHSLRVQA